LHFVKGGCALLQAAELTGLLKELEGDAKAGRLDRVDEQLPELEAMIEALMRRAEIAGA
jgi:HPt (histidine-containing phosphotransfer) domain-containing protein